MCEKKMFRELLLVCVLFSAVGGNGLFFKPWSRNTKEVKLTRLTDVQCDTTHFCPDGNTCCKRPGGDWGCCPLPDAVCCSDGIHCCPSGTICNLTAQSCDRMQVKLRSIEKQVGDVKCDATFSCPDGNTCCRLKSGHWGCCPLPKAVCCSDKVHCCPHGTTCDVAAGLCISESGTSVTWRVKRSLG